MKHRFQGSRDADYLARDPACSIAPGDRIELRRLPGVEWVVVSVLKREDLEGHARFLLEINCGQGSAFMWHNDPEETLWSLIEVSPWEEPQSSAILED